MNADHEIAVATAALLHDVGHGPFSHTLEEILTDLKVDFHHEKITVRFMTEEGSEINGLLREVDAGLPQIVGGFISHELRGEDDHWRHKIVSSQMDADRLDYLLRDAYFCGLKGPGFDLARILDLIQHNEGIRIAVDEGALEAVEAYLVTLDQLYRAIYYHHAVRASNRLLTSAVRRAIILNREGDKLVFRWRDHPLRQLVEKGNAIELSTYALLGEHHLWALLDDWRRHKDPILADLASRVIARKLLKSVSVPVTSYPEMKRYGELAAQARDVALKILPNVSKETVDYYVCEDAPERTSYKRYTWKPESENNSIWINGKDGKGVPIEEDTRSRIIQGLKDTRYFPRIMMPLEVREQLKL